MLAVAMLDTNPDEELLDEEIDNVKSWVSTWSKSMLHCFIYKEYKKDWFLCITESIKGAIPMENGCG